MKNGFSTKKNSVVIIPARGGSKGIPHKNVKIVAGRPLIHYVIETCLKTPEIGTIAVSTESNEIRNAVKLFKDILVIDRPAELAADDTPSEDVIIHAIGILENKGIVFENVLFVQATSPLTCPLDFSILLSKLDEGNDSAAFYSEDHGFFFDNDDEIFKPHLPRQLRTPRKREAGNGWAFKKNGFLKNRSRLFGRIGLCKIDYPKHLEIDSESDLIIVERLMQLRERKRSGLYYQSRKVETSINADAFESKYWGTIIDPDGKKRNRLLEKEQRIDDVKEEINYINKLAPGKVLDIGCGMGDLLSAINDKWKKYGLEFSSLAANEAAKYGDIFTGPLVDAPYEKEFFDLVVMHHVIEHLEKPEDDIVRVSKILKQSGRLIISTPDFDGAMARYFKENYRLLHDKTHISLFSRISLRHFLEDFGFEIEFESFPFFETRHFNKNNILRLLETDSISPPFWGSFMTFYCIKK